VGQGLIQQPGIAALALGAISDLRLDLISQGSSPNSLVMVFDETHLETGLKRIHRHFFQRDT
jgi:aspartokinase